MINLTHIPARTLFLLGLLAMLLGVGPGGCVLIIGARSEIIEEEALSLPAQAVHELAVRSENGAIKIVGEPDGDQIQVIARKKGHGTSDSDAEACAKAIRIETEVVEGRQRIGWGWAGAKKSRWRGEVAFEIHAPARLAVYARSHNGQMEMEGLAGGVNVETNNGAIHARQIAGNLKVRTDNGAIQIENHHTELGGELSARTSNGQIRANSSAGAIHLTTSNGAIEGDLCGNSLVNGTIETSNGAITLGFGEKVSTEIVCNTSNGEIRSDRPIEGKIQEKRRLTGRIGSGEGRLAVTTGNGAITLR